jgi:hypothetical protein
MKCPGSHPLPGEDPEYCGDANRMLTFKATCVSDGIPNYMPCGKSSPGAKLPFCDATLPKAERIKDMIGRMTLKQKCAQTNDCMGAMPEIGWQGKPCHTVVPMSREREREIETERGGGKQGEEREPSTRVRCGCVVWVTCEERGAKRGQIQPSCCCVRVLRLPTTTRTHNDTWPPPSPFSPSFFLLFFPDGLPFLLRDLRDLFDLFDLFAHFILFVLLVLLVLLGYNWNTECLHGLGAICLTVGNETRCPSVFATPPLLGATFNRTVAHQLGEVRWRDVERARGAEIQMHGWTAGWMRRREAGRGAVQEGEIDARRASGQMRRRKGREGETELLPQRTFCSLPQPPYRTDANKRTLVY